MTETRPIIDTVDAERLAEYLAGLSMPFTVTVRPGAARSLSQNALLHKWYGEIAQQQNQDDAIGVKATCHVDYGVAIRRRDELFNYVWMNTLAKLPYEKQVAFFRKQYRKVKGVDDVAVFQMTSAMSKDELKDEYMAPMFKDYTDQGFALTVPEDRK